MLNRLDDAHFEQVYADGPDPWGFERRFYEKRKYALTLASLPRERYRRAFEPGCASGVLSELLALRVDELVSMELVPTIADRARHRLRTHTNVRVDTGALPETWPEGTFDLVVASEVLYYLRAEGLDRVVALLAHGLEPGGHLVAVHWRLATDYPLSGDVVHERLRTAPFLKLLGGYEQPEFRLDVFERT